jgi:3-deoxy-D-manno-octulosonic-acid transferase
MYLYIFLIRIAALFGHRKARLMMQGQAEAKQRLTTQGNHLKGAIWIHVSSVGEFEQARPLIEQLRSKNEKVKIVLTFFSPSGYELRKNYNLADAVLYLPFATRRNAGRFLDAIQPRVAVFVKYEFWPAYLRELKKRAVPTYSICSIFRPKQLFFRWWGKWYLRLLHCFTHLYVQDEASKVLLQSHGVNHCSVVGDTRFDRVSAIVADSAAANNERLQPVALFAEGCGQIIIAGSSWPQDEELLAHYITEHPDTKLILVPHEIDEAHLHFIFNLFQGRFVRYTAVSSQPSVIARRNVLRHANVMVVDTIGLLSSIYRFGHVAYIGGGFGVGIHNTIEAAVYGLPVIFGPNYMNFREAKGLIAVGAARSIGSYPEIEAALDTALAQHNEIGAKAAAYVEAEKGATEKIYREIFGK